MIFLKINDMKTFTSLLLVKNTFDKMELVEGTIKTHSTFVINGAKNASYYTDTDEEPENQKENLQCSFLPDEYVTWEKLRPVCYEIIKGKRLPLYFKFVFRLDNSRTAGLLAGLPDWNPADIAGLFLNIKYENGVLSLTTGTSLKTFTLDKSLDKAFDSFITAFLAENSIDYSIC